MPIGAVQKSSLMSVDLSLDLIGDEFQLQTSTSFGHGRDGYCAAIDATRALVVHRTSGGVLKAFIYDKSGETTGSETTVVAGAGAHSGLCVLSSSVAVVTVYDSTSGTGNAYVINIGAGTTITSIGSANAFPSTMLNLGYCSATKASSSIVVCTYTDSAGSDLYVVAGSVSGDTITFGTEVLASSSAPTDVGCACDTALSGAVIFGRSGATSQMRAFTLSGTTITLGAAITFSSSTNSSKVALVAAGTQEFIGAWVESGAIKVANISRSTTTLTQNTAIEAAGTVVANTDIVLVFGSGTIYGLAHKQAADTLVYTRIQLIGNSVINRGSSDETLDSNDLGLSVEDGTAGTRLCVYQDVTASADLSGRIITV